MKIYTESIFLLNFLLDYMILYGTKRILKISCGKKRLLLGAITGSLTTIFLFIKVSNITLLILKIGISILMIITSFGVKNIKQNLLYFYMISISIGGAIYLLNIKTSFYINCLILVVLTPMIIRFMKKRIMEYHLNNKEKYKVNITLKKKTYQLDGYIDTGNHLKSPISKKSVILVNLEIPEEKVIYIPFKALNTEGVIPCMKPEKVVINEKEIKNYLIGFSKDKINLAGCNCILPNQIREEL